MAAGVHAAVAAPTHKVYSNAATSGDEDGVVVVDSRSRPSAARVLEVAPRDETPFFKYPDYRPWRPRVLANIEHIYAAVARALQSDVPGSSGLLGLQPTLDIALRQRSCYIKVD